MMSRPSRFSILLLLLLFFSDMLMFGGGVGMGINYGKIANDLPSPSRVRDLLQSIDINRVKLYDADSSVLSAFSNSEMEFTIGLGNEYVAEMIDTNTARAWVREHVQSYLPKTRISCITVGNEVLTSDDAQLRSNLLPAMESVRKALASLELDEQVIVTTAHSLNILSTSYPPSSGAFEENLIEEYIEPLLIFLSQFGFPFLINAYPYFAYKENPDRVSLGYVLFESNQSMIDPGTGFAYDNMLFAQVDAVYSAIDAMGHGGVQVKISETGWPSKGDSDEVGASPENAGIYHRNLLQRLLMNQTTPARPKVPLDVYVFALFNEDLKPGPASERNYGLFYPNGTSVYPNGLHAFLLPFSGSTIDQLSAPTILFLVIVHFICSLQS